MNVESDILRIERELELLSNSEDLPIRTALYRNLVALRLLLWVGGGGSVGPLVDHVVTYLDSTVYKLIIPATANYAELYFEDSDSEDANLVARVTLGDNPPTTGTGLNQHGRRVRNEGIVRYSRRDELERLQIKKYPAVNNLRLEVNYYA
jgi:hypothetical protein